jgi:hypothetical protein
LVSAVDFDQYRMGDCGMPVRERRTALTAIAIASLAMVSGAVRAQQPTAPAAAIASGPAIGDVAPDFALDGATRYGLLKTPVRLADYRGRTVVLAFFYQARTKG